jgi:hypothetical protein
MAATNTLAYCAGPSMTHGKKVFIIPSIERPALSMRLHPALLGRERHLGPERPQPEERDLPVRGPGPPFPRRDRHEADLVLHVQEVGVRRCRRPNVRRPGINFIKNLCP